jgi:hypothetical protein
VQERGFVHETGALAGGKQTAIDCECDGNHGRRPAAGLNSTQRRDMSRRKTKPSRHWFLCVRPNWTPLRWSRVASLCCVCIAPTLPCVVVAVGSHPPRHARGSAGERTGGPTLAIRWLRVRLPPVVLKAPCRELSIVVFPSPPFSQVTSPSAVIWETTSVLQSIRMVLLLRSSISSSDEGVIRISRRLFQFDRPEETTLHADVP